MSDAEEALDDLLTACRDVPGLTGDTADRLGTAALPCALVGAPTLESEGMCPEPTKATFPVTLLVRLDGGAIRRLLGFVSVLSGVLEADTDGVVTRALPLSYDLGGGIIAAAYELTVEFPLA